MIGHIGTVMVLQSHDEGNESISGNLERLQQISLLQKKYISQVKKMYYACLFLCFFVFSASNSVQCLSLAQTKNYLEDGVHGDCQWAIPRILSNLKDVNAPSVNILHLLQVNDQEM